MVSSGPVKDGLIRASQGHSVPVDLGLKPVPPPEVLYHGTYHKVVGSIRQKGLLKMNRHAVHLASETTTAETVGRRSGTPVLFKVLAQAMHKDGYAFFVSDNGVWLTNHVPPQYLEQISNPRTS